MQLQDMMAMHRWHDIYYNAVHASAMKNYKSSFEKHDRERFAGYLKQVREGKTRISVSGIQPYELVCEASRHLG